MRQKTDRTQLDNRQRRKLQTMARRSGPSVLMASVAYPWRPAMFCSVTNNMSDSLQPHGLEHARLPCPSLSSGFCSNSSPSSQWCHPITSTSGALFSSCLQYFPASESFPVSQFFISGGKSIEASASASVLPMNSQGWFPLGWTGWISLLSKGLSRVFSSTTVWKHQLRKL